jgi:hypothetical protein
LRCVLLTSALCLQPCNLLFLVLHVVSTMIMPCSTPCMLVSNCPSWAVKLGCMLLRNADLFLQKVQLALIWDD